MLCSLAIALSVTDLGLLLGLVGSTGSALVSLLLPGLCYLRCVPDGPTHLRTAALAQVCVGSAMIPLCVVLTLIA